jgi:hypothetical protein
MPSSSSGSSEGKSAVRTAAVDAGQTRKDPQVTLTANFNISTYVVLLTCSWAKSYRH